MVHGLDEGWCISRGSSAITIGILDGPVDMEHPSLLGAELSQISFSHPGETLEPSSHGTQVAGILFGQDALVRGIVPGCRGLSIPIWGPSRDTFQPCSQEALAQAILHAAEAGAHIINISGGELSPADNVSPFLIEAIQACEVRHILIVAAVGNEGCLCPHVPAAIPEVLAVGAMDIQGKPLSFSNWSPAYDYSGLLAPGESIVTARAGGGVQTVSGTSYATAIVSGIAALLLSVQIELGQQADPLYVREVLLQTADPCNPQTENYCERALAGRINVTAALQKIHERNISKADADSPLPLVTAILPSGLSSAYGSEGEAEPSELDLNLELSCNTLEREMSETISAIGTLAADVDISGTAHSSAAPAAMRENQGIIAAGIEPSDCGCGCTKSAEELVYVVGTIGYDFGSRARQESFAADMAASGAGTNPYDTAALVHYLSDHLFAATDLIWTLNVESIPVYGIVPQGAFSARGYELLVALLKEQHANNAGAPNARMVSVPGKLHGTVRLQSGQQVPAIEPALRGVYSWTVDSVIEQALQGVAGESLDARRKQFQNFFQRFFYELRNQGRTPSERAINFGGTAVFRLGEVFLGKIQEDLVLHRIEVAKSMVCPPGSSCWDVSLSFFHPKQMLERAREVLRFTVDVSQEIPVRIGSVNSWATHS